MSIGHVIVGVRDLDRATQRFEAMGFCVLDGGVHPGVGTANRVIPLGDSYLELLGVVDRGQASSTVFGQSLLERTADGDRLVRWSIRTQSIDRVGTRLGLVVEHRRRQRPDRSLLTWRAAGLDLSLREPWLPFFMQWDDPDEFPGRIPVHHPIGECALSWVRISPADPDQLKRWTDDDPELPLRLGDSTEGIEAVAIATPSGELIIDNRVLNDRT